MSSGSILAPSSISSNCSVIERWSSFLKSSPSAFSPVANSGYTKLQSGSSCGGSKAEKKKMIASVLRPRIRKKLAKGQCWILKSAPMITTAAPIPYSLAMKFFHFLLPGFIVRPCVLGLVWRKGMVYECDRAGSVTVGYSLV